MKEILPLKSKIGQLFQVLYSMLMFQIFCLKFSFPFMFCIELSSLSIHSMFCIASWTLDLIFHRYWNPTEKTMWSDYWPRHGQLGSQGLPDWHYNDLLWGQGVNCGRHWDASPDTLSGDDLSQSWECRLEMACSSQLLSGVPKLRGLSHLSLHPSQAPTSTGWL